MEQSVHWADIYAEKIIREKGQKGQYVCASGITPSGTVHIGNFREIISVELVVRALRRLGVEVRFIYSWDDFDVFRKVPADMPCRERLEEYLRFPITMVPDLISGKESYARANEIRLEEVMAHVGVYPEYIYQAQKYAAGEYAEGMRRALEGGELIKAVLNRHRTEPLPPEWSPVSVFCSNCHRDTTQMGEWDGGWVLRYSCGSCGHTEELDLQNAAGAKLKWRVDWPMRWAYEGVDFEPAGKEHHSAGGSFDTAKEIAVKIYDYQPPVTFKYDFISIKGMGGKISSSLGNVLSVSDVLEVYQPEIVRYMFAGTKPDTEFAISFDLDVIKLYEDYDRCEQVYFGYEQMGEKRKQKERRIYELSQVDTIPEHMPVQMPFRHLCNLLQIYDGEISPALERFCETEGVKLTGEARERAETRSRCAWNWIQNHAPEEFRFVLKSADDPVEVLDAKSHAALAGLCDALESGFESQTEESLGTLFYTLAEKHDLKPKELFRIFYRVLLGKDRGPRLAAFILAAGTERILPVLKRY